MKKITLHTEFDFDSAHRLVGYCGLCSQLHGHIWKVNLDIIGTDDMLDNVGILWDFTNAKDIKKLFDHKTILKDCKENKELIKVLQKVCGKDSVYLMDENPTAEHLAEEILVHCLTSNPDLYYRVQVYESAKSYAEKTTKKINEGEEDDGPF